MRLDRVNAAAESRRRAIVEHGRLSAKARGLEAAAERAAIEAARPNATTRDATRAAIYATRAAEARRIADAADPARLRRRSRDDARRLAAIESERRDAVTGVVAPGVASDADTSFDARFATRRAIEGAIEAAPDADPGARHAAAVAAAVAAVASARAARDPGGAFLRSKAPRKAPKPRPAPILAELSDDERERRRAIEAARETTVLADEGAVPIPRDADGRIDRSAIEAARRYLLGNGDAWRAPDDYRAPGA